jgi:hypothetical protein
MSHTFLENWVLQMTKFCFYQYTDRPKNTTFFSFIKVMFFPANYTTQPQYLYLSIVHTLKYHYRKQLIYKTATTVGWGDSSKMLMYT